MDPTWIWIPATLLAAAAQAGRNAVQRSLTAQLGTLGATQVRFLYGFPFALLFLGLAIAGTGAAPPALNLGFLAYVAGGAVCQIAATALMLAAMRERAFVVVTAWTKTEPIQVALFAFVVLGDPLSLGAAAAIVVATVGVVLLSVKPGTPLLQDGGLRPVLFGLVSGAFFALSAVGFRGAMLQAPGAPFIVLASWTLAWSLFMQAVMLMGWMLLRDRELLRNCLKAWRVSILGGLLGASASQGWFVGFSLTAAANVRTLGLVEVLFAHWLSGKVFAQASTGRDKLGILLVVAGAALLIWLMPPA
ncbi:EamA/RhaT family transporter [Orrella sp. JC864]|uniref:EamA/RhaT family transporter n=1 Tax=Orrella sp. JC864 TaxID=3120298 RepID=UPI0012BB7714